MNPKAPYIFFLLLLCSLSAFTQSLQYQHFTVQDGLPHDITYEVLQDHLGFIWVGTDYGLARFDGKGWKYYNGKEGFKNPYVICLQEYQDTLWVGTYGDGLYYLVGDSAYHYQSASIPSKIYQFHIQDDVCYIPHEYNLTSIPLLEQASSRLHRLYQSGDRLELSKINKSAISRMVRINLANGPAGNLLIFPAKQAIKGLLAYQKGETKYYFPQSEISFCRKEADGYLIGSEGSVWQYDEKLDKNKCLWRLPATHAHKLMYDFLPLDQNWCWLRLLHEGKQEDWLVDTLKKEWIDIQQMIGSTSAHSYLMVDQNKDVWLSTHGDGLYHIYLPRFEQVTDEAVLDNLFINCIYEEDEKVYVGTFDGVYVRNKGETSFRRIKLKDKLNEQVEIANIERTSLGDFVIAADNQPLAWNEKGELIPEFRLSKNILSVNENSYWSWAFSRIYLVSEENGNRQICDTSLKNVRLFDLEAIDQQNFLLGTDVGVFSVTRNGCEFQLNPTEEFSNILIYDIEIESESRYWYGTNEGLFVKENGKLRKIEGLISEQIPHLQLDQKGRLWVGTPRGLHCIIDEQIFTWKMRNGLAADDVQAIKEMKNGDIWIGSSKGITIIHPEDVPHRLSHTNLEYSLLRINDQLFNPNQLYKFDYQEPVRITFEAHAYLYPELTQYRYRLDQNPSWEGLQNPSILFQDMRSGKHEVWIQAKEFNKDWSEAIQLTFEVRPPWWQNWRYLLALGLLIALLSSFAVWLRGKMIQSRLLLERNYVSSQLQALQAQLNPHFISNVLTAIQFYILQEDALMASQFLTKFARLTRLCMEGSIHKFISLKDELEIIENYLSLEELRLKDRFQYNIQIDPKLNIQSIKIPAMLLLHYIENAVNHGIVYKKEGGELRIVFSQNEKYLLICDVEDNGIGREKSREIKANSSSQYASRGSVIADNMIELSKKLLGRQITAQTMDLYDQEGNATGTKVRLQIER